MLDTARGILLAVAACAAALVPASALAFGHHGPRPGEVARVEVRQRAEARVGARCSYRATVHGHLAQLAAGGSEPRYAPQLRVDDEVHCPGEAVQYREHRVRAAAMTRAQLVRAVEQAAAMTGVVEGRRCALAAQFDLTGTTTRIAPVAPACSDPVPARGGGPGIVSPEEIARRRRERRRWERGAAGFDTERNMPVAGTRFLQ